jgi:hypothetical protein
MVWPALQNHLVRDSFIIEFARFAAMLGQEIETGIETRTHLVLQSAVHRFPVSTGLDSFAQSAGNLRQKPPRPLPAVKVARKSKRDFRKKYRT